MSVQSTVTRMANFLSTPLKGSGIGNVFPFKWLYRVWLMRLIRQHTEPFEVNGYKLYVDNNKYDCVAQQLIMNGAYEPYTTSVFQKILKPGMTVIDIGANIGYFTLLSARIVGENGKVFAFEPLPQNYKVLSKNISTNNFKNVSAFQKAVSNSAGMLELYFNAKETGTPSLVGKSSSLSMHVSVETVTIDDFLKDQLGKVDLIKIDVEGAEMMVLSGMLGIIKSSPSARIICEFCPDVLTRSGTDPLDYLKYLNSIGFKHIYVMDDDRLTLDEVDFKKVIDRCYAGVLHQPSHVNLLCSKDPV